MLSSNKAGSAESVVDKLTDISVYAKLAHILYVEGTEKK